MKNQSKVQTARNASFEKTHQKILDAFEAYITGGWAQTLAQLLVYMGTERANETFDKLPADMRAAVESQYKAMEGKKRTDPDVISAAGFVLKNSGFYGKALAQDATKNLGQMQIREMQLACDELFEEDPLLAMNIENFTYTFKDICGMGDREVQRILREVDTEVLALALKSEIEVQRKVFKNMSRRAALMLREDMEFMGPVKISDVERAQKKIMDVVKRLAAKGDILIKGRLNYADCL